MSWKVLEPLPSPAFFLPTGTCRNHLLYLDPATRLLMSARIQPGGSSTPWKVASPPVPGGGGPLSAGRLLILGDHVHVLHPIDASAVNMSTISTQGSSVWVGRMAGDGTISSWAADTSLPEPMAGLNASQMAPVGSGFVMPGSAAPRVTLAFSNQTADFAIGEVVRGATSGATGAIIAQTDTGTGGTLYFRSGTGLFQNGEALIGNMGGGGTAAGEPNQNFTFLDRTVYYVDSNGSRISGYRAMPHSVIPDEFLYLSSGGTVSAGHYIYQFSYNTLMQGCVMDKERIYWEFIQFPFTAAHALLGFSGRALMLFGGYDLEAVGPVPDVRVIPLDSEMNVTGAGYFRTCPMPAPLYAHGGAMDPKSRTIYIVGGMSAGNTPSTVVASCRLPQDGVIDGMRY
jgi:hypothetical protein